MNLDIYRNLLEQASIINSRYMRINELTGENFNIFRILKLQSSEVRLHSAFLSELLNPKGNHGQGDVFLKFFVDNFQFKNNGFDTASATVEIEKHSGLINESGTEGGRIDIMITDKDRKQIIIENKIYAGDQKNQLIRYSSYSKTADLLYLTLEGKKPDISSSGDLVEGVDFNCISYKTHITDWLEKCRKEVAIYPIIRETITQYLNLIKFLTNQTMNDSMSNELATLITSNLNNVEAAFTIIHNLEPIKEHLLIKFRSEMIELANELNFLVTDDIDFSQQYSGFYFYRKGWSNGSIAFGFQSYSNVLLYGILLDKPELYSDKARERLLTVKPSDAKTSEWWPIYRPFESPFNNWNNSKEVWTAVANGSMAIQFRHRLVEFINLIDSKGISF